MPVVAAPQARPFVAQRNFTLATTLGHRIVFKAGEPVSVPREIEHEALSAGATPVDGKPSEMIEIAPELTTGPVDPVDRKSEIKAAMQKIMAANRRGDFAASGHPKCAAIGKLLGYDVDSKERDRLWQEIHDEAAGE